MIALIYLCGGGGGGIPGGDGGDGDGGIPGEMVLLIKHVNRIEKHHTAVNLIQDTRAYPSLRRALNTW